MTSAPNPTPTGLRDKAVAAPDIIPTRLVSKSEEDSKSGPSALQKAAQAVAGMAVPAVDKTLRAASGSTAKPAKARPSLGRRLLRGVIGMVITACLAGAAVLWQSRGQAVGQMVAKWAPPFVTTWLSPQQSPPADQAADAPAAEATSDTAALPPSSPQSAADSAGSNAADPIGDSAQLLQSMARDLAGLRQEMEQMKAGLAELRAGQDQMARDAARWSDPNLRPRLSTAATPPVPTARKPIPTPRPVPTAAPASAQAAIPSTTPRRTVPRAAAAPLAPMPPLPQ